MCRSTFWGSTPPARSFLLLENVCKTQTSIFFPAASFLRLSLPLAPLISAAVACYNVNEPLSTEPVMVSALSLVSALIRSRVQLTFTRLLCRRALHEGHTGQNNTRGNFNDPDASGRKLPGDDDVIECWQIAQKCINEALKREKGSLEASILTNSYRFLLHYISTKTGLVVYINLTVGPAITSLMAENSSPLLSPTVSCRSSSARLKLIGWP